SIVNDSGANEMRVILPPWYDAEGNQLHIRTRELC
ncbi:MAG: hypothetical protein HW407_1046, partial [Bacteroidetes bacterium]|nr:hypothetical protein [Bacteroidota bacterium]